MTLEDIQNLWSEDCHIDRTALDAESLKIPSLHQKYYKHYLREYYKLKKEEGDYNDLKRLKHEYYTGKLSQKELNDLGWEPFQFILKGELPLYLDSDKELSEILIRIEMQKEKVKYLESIIKSLKDRNFLIKNAIEFIKFSNGA